MIIIGVFTKEPKPQCAPARMQAIQDRLERAIAACGLSEKQVAASLGVNQNRWHEMKTGERSLPFHRFTILVPEVWKEFNWLTMLEEGLPFRVERTAPLAARLNLEKRRSA